MIYLSGFTIPDESAEWNFFVYGTKETCFNTYYPYQIFPEMEFEKMTFETITIFYGGNGTGKTTLLNIIAEKMHLTRNAVFNRSSFFERYVSSCRADIEKTIPNASRIPSLNKVYAVFKEFVEISKADTIHEDRIKENIDIFDFELSAEEQDALKALDKAAPMIGRPESPELVEMAMTW